MVHVFEIFANVLNLSDHTVGEPVHSVKNYIAPIQWTFGLCQLFCFITVRDGLLELPRLSWI